MKRFRHLLIMAIVIIFAVVGNTQSALDRIVKDGAIRVGVSGTQPPYSLVSNSNEIIGFEVDLARMLAESMKVELEIVQMPFAELLNGLESGAVDIVMSGMTITTQRNLRVLFVGPYNISGKTILTKTANLSKIDTESEAGAIGFKVAALKGSTSESFARGYLSNATIVTTNNYDEAVAMVLNDEIDAMVADVEICQVSMLKFPDKDLAMLKEPLTIEPIGMALPAADYQLMNLVDNYYTSLEMLGVLEALREKWFKDGTWLLQAK